MCSVQGYPAGLISSAQRLVAGGLRRRILEPPANSSAHERTKTVNKAATAKYRLMLAVGRAGNGECINGQPPMGWQGVAEGFQKYRGGG